MRHEDMATKMPRDLDMVEASVLDYLRFVIECRRMDCVISRPYANFEDFVLLNGRHFNVIPYPAKYKRRTAYLKACFLNTYKLADKYPDLKYVEGYAKAERVCGGLHAWVVDPSGNVIDPTWQNDATEYYGVIFNMDYVRRVLNQKKEYGVIDNWKNQWALLDGTETEWKVTG